MASPLVSSNKVGFLLFSMPSKAAKSEHTNNLVGLGQRDAIRIWLFGKCAKRLFKRGSLRSLDRLFAQAESSHIYSLVNVMTDPWCSSSEQEKSEYCQVNYTENINQAM